jgi:hypothetical protein
VDDTAAGSADPHSGRNYSAGKARKDVVQSRPKTASSDVVPRESRQPEAGYQVPIVAPHGVVPAARRSTEDPTPACGSMSTPGGPPYVDWMLVRGGDWRPVKPVTRRSPGRYGATG